MEETMSRKLLYTLIAISIAASVLISANKLAKKQPVYINRGSGEVTVSLSSQYAVARFGWGACSKGMEQDFIDHFVVNLQLLQNGVVLQTVTTNQGIWTMNATNPAPVCLHINEPQLAYWEYANLNLKKPGTYTLVFSSEWTAPLADGGDYDGNGFVDIFPPTDLGSPQITINVVP